MALTPRLDLRQSQQLVMTPQLQQAIKLLQLSNLELADYVEQEVEKNPLLEHEDGAAQYAETDGPEPEAEAPDKAETSEAALETMDLSSDEGYAAREEQSYDVDYDNLYSTDAPGDAGDRGEQGLGSTAFADWGTGGGGSFDFPDYDLEQTLSGTETLRDHLLNQLYIEIDDPAQRTIALHLLDMLDEAGYLAGDLQHLADLLGCPLADVEAVLAVLQEFDPPGLFARDLKECLALQLKDRNRLDPAMAALLDHLDLLARRDIPGLARVCGVDADDVADMLAEVRALDPKPALRWDHAAAQPVTPDVLMRAKAGGGWIIELNNETLPRVLVNNQYYAQVSSQASGKADKQYLNDCLQSANWLARSLHQRATTILKVATELVRQQDAFFRHGVQHLKPLVLRDIAEVIGMHESTVSRVTSNKYISTPRGIYELKYFFTTAIGSASGGDAHSAESVRHRIRSLIDAEDPKKILSDDKLVALLRADGVDIARRTVAKYREAMGIPSSVQRRREKASRL